MEIREARREEYDAVRQAMLAAYGEYGTMFGEEVWRDYAEEIADIESREPEGAVVLVAAEGDEILGAVTYYPPGTGGGYAETWPRPWAGFRLLAVPPAQRGHGLGRVLTRACIERARADGAVVLALGTTEVMKTARGLYERMGFEPSPEHDYYPVPQVRVYAYTMPLAG